MIPKTELFFRSGNSSEANFLIKTYHYSHRVPANVQFIGTFHLQGGLFGDYGPAIAAVCFTIPATRWNENVWELSRLVRFDDSQVPLTSLIALACKIIKRKIDLIVSFADPQQNHHGGIYQAASWNYHGRRSASVDGLLINGVFVPGRSCNSTWGTRSSNKLKQAHPQWNIQPHIDTGKHLYWKALRKSGSAKANRLGLECNAYPKPDLSCR